jgi:hypothetical protein
MLSLFGSDVMAFIGNPSITIGTDPTTVSIFHTQVYRDEYLKALLG